jgi:exopolysaccharide biosynthesis polyprenyl glycosylphosphotransferase
MRVLILGAGPIALKLMDEVDALGAAGVTIVGIVDDCALDEALQNRTMWLGQLDRLAQVVTQERVERIVVALEDRRGRLPLNALLDSRARGVVVEEALAFCERLTGKIAIEALTPGPLILSNGFRNSGTPETVARAVSVIVAVIGLVLLAPLLALVALAVKLDSKGPVVFVQSRSGKHGRPFDLLKFRTMHPSDERRSEWVQDNSDRITRVGSWLRRYRLDELPQLVNILRGDMNLIGPRPHPVCNQEAFEQQIAYYGLRSTVRPGVTGWAQVRYGYANNIAEETEKMRYDLYYIKNRSLLLDARILLGTISIILLGHASDHVRYGAPLADQPSGDPALGPVPVNLDPLSR